MYVSHVDQHCDWTHDGQIYDTDNYGLHFGGGGDLGFWYRHSFALGQRTNGCTHVGSSFVTPAEGPFALNNGEQEDFVFAAFQVLLVRPVDGLHLRFGVLLRYIHC
jgi:hypothetical protein